MKKLISIIALIALVLAYAIWTTNEIGHAEVTKKTETLERTVWDIDGNEYKMQYDVTIYNSGDTGEEIILENEKGAFEDSLRIVSKSVKDADGNEYMLDLHYIVFRNEAGVEITALRVSESEFLDYEREAETNWAGQLLNQICNVFH